MELTQSEKNDISMSKLRFEPATSHMLSKYVANGYNNHEYRGKFVHKGEVKLNYK